AVDSIGLALARVAPEAAAGVAARETRYLHALRRLDSGSEACMAAVPRAQRKLVTDHDAFGYFATRYGINVVGAAIPARTTVAQPSAGELAALVNTIKGEHVRAVFPEASVNSKVAETLA